MAATALLSLLALASAATARCVPPSGACAAASSVIRQLRSCVDVVPFCYSVLDVHTATATETEYSTPVVDVTSWATVAETKVATRIETQTITVVTTDYTTFLTTDYFTVTITDAASSTTTVVQTTTYTTSVPTITAKKRTIRRRAPTISQPEVPVSTVTATATNCLSSLAASDITNACSCLALPLPTVTVTDIEYVTTVTDFFDATATGPTVYVTESEVVTETAVSTAQATAESTVDVTSTATFSTTVWQTATSVTTVTPAPTCGVNLIQNPEFLDGNNPTLGWTLTNNEFGGASLVNYGVSGTSSRSLDLWTSGGGYGWTSMAQTIPIVPNKEYAVGIWTYVETASGTTTIFNCTAGSSTLFTYNLNVDSYAGWHQLNGWFLGLSDSVTISCGVTSDVPGEIYVDALSVECSDELQ